MVWGVRRWRWAVAAAAVVPAGVALLSGGGLVAVAALLLALPVLAVAFVAPGLRSALITTGVLIAATIGLRLRSGLRTGALRPPPGDWEWPALLVAAVVVVVVVALRWQRERPLNDQNSSARVLLLGLGAALLAGCLCGIGGLAFNLGPFGKAGGPYAVASPASYLPLPPGLAVRTFDPECSGTHAPCTLLYEVWDPAGADAQAVTDRIAAHLRGRGWPMVPDGAARQEGCRTMAGVFTWQQRCATISVPVTERWFPGPRQPGSIELILH